MHDSVDTQKADGLWNHVGMVHAWVAQKRLERDILRLFTMSLFENIYGNYRIMPRNRKRLFKGLNKILTPPTKNSVKLVKCFSSV